MRRRLLDLIRCPACHAGLELHAFREEPNELAPGLPGSDAPDFAQQYGTETTEGLLTCSGCDLVYPVIESVPRVIRNAYGEYTEWFFQHRAALSGLEGLAEVVARLGQIDGSVFDKRSNESFSLQWQMYQYGDKTWFKNDEDLRHDEFLDSMKLRPEELDGRLVLDAGCGNGRLTSTVALYGAEVVGMDLSRSVVRANLARLDVAKERAPFVHFVQGNVMEPPLEPGGFHHIHTSGVLHHTPSTERAFESFLSLGKPGARVYVQLYRKREAWVGVPNRVLRWFTSRLPVKLLYRLCYLMAPVHQFLVLCVARLRGEKSLIAHTSRREQAISLFDNYSPRYQYRYTPDQVRSMFEEAGLSNVRDVTFDNEARHMVAFLGEK
jgi:SAM-dependent methyltransferase/uncharacterized protein YbaR (Trm112 family)